MRVDDLINRLLELPYDDYVYVRGKESGGKPIYYNLAHIEHSPHDHIITLEGNYEESEE